MQNKNHLESIPTNLIMGFLGTGKTTSILHLVAQKPASETWAILVNEFGKVGIDGKILASSNATVAQVSGGCFCCISGPSFDVTLNRLLIKTRPDRLLIEPTGLGHPRQIIEKLTSAPHNNVLDLRASICLVDPRHLAQERYLQHETFIEQINCADILIANKTDLCNSEEIKRFYEFSITKKEHGPITKTIEHGQIDIQLLDAETQHQKTPTYPNFRPATKTDRSETSAGITQDVPPNWKRSEHSADGFYSCSWSIPGQVIFNLGEIRSWIKSFDIERIKAIVNTDNGWLVLNGNTGAIDIMPTTPEESSTIEITTTDILSNQIEAKLSDCIQ